MMTHSQAQMILLRSRNGRKKVANHTWLQWTNILDISVVYLGTPVVTMYANNTYRLNSSGFRTATTKNRINQFGPAYVFADNGRWYWSDGDRCGEFVDGMVFGADGTPWDGLGSVRPADITTDTDSDSRGPA